MLDLDQLIGNARQERNKFYIYRIVNKNYFQCWTGEGNVKNSDS